MSTPGIIEVFDVIEHISLGLIEADKDITRAEIAGRLEAECGLRVVPSTIW